MLQPSHLIQIRDTPMAILDGVAMVRWYGDKKEQMLFHQRTRKPRPARIPYPSFSSHSDTRK